MHDRMVELINRGMDKYNKNPPRQFFSSFLADYLLDNDVIVLPCKVGDTVYILETLPDSDKCENCKYYYEGGMGDYPACEKTRYGYRATECIEIVEVIVTKKQLYWWLYMNEFGKTVFLTREEAEQALKGGAE